MNDEDLTVSPPLADPNPEDVTRETELVVEDAEHEIDRAVRGRRGIARKYVIRLRRRAPDATPAEIVGMLERHYVTAISVAGAAITVGSIAAEIGIAMIPIVGPAATGTKAAAKQAGRTATKEATKAVAKQAGKTATKEATKAVAKQAGKTAAEEATKAAANVAAKTAALRAAKSGAEWATAVLPAAGDKQLQFEITALFALAVADIHGMQLDQEQAHALVYSLSNGRVSQKQIAAMASDLAQSSDSEIVRVGHTIAEGRKDWGHWANTLADCLPGGAAQSLVRGVQTGILEDIRGGLDGKQQAAVNYGVGALVGGVTRFVFGREVVEAARLAFSDPPDSFPAHLDVPPKLEKADDEPNRALEALDDAAKAVSAGLSSGAVAVGTSLRAAADTVTRPFHSVDVDGDGALDEPRALTAVKGAGGAIVGAAGAVSGGVAGRFRPKKVVGRFRRKREGRDPAGGPQRDLKPAATRRAPRR